MKLSKLVLGLSLALGFVAAASAQTTMKISISTAQNSHQGIAIATFAKAVEKRTGGRYKIQTFYNGALGGERESIEAVQLGTHELTFTSTGPVPNFVPEAKILDVPFLFRDKAHAPAVLGLELLVAQALHDFLVLDLALVGDQDARRDPSMVGQRNAPAGAFERGVGGRERRVAFDGAQQRGKLAERESAVDGVGLGLVDVGQVAALHHQHQVGVVQHLGAELGADVVGEVELAAGHRLGRPGSGAEAALEPTDRAHLGGDVPLLELSLIHI